MRNHIEDKRGKAADSDLSVSFKKLLSAVRRRQQERIRKAGKHQCIPVYAGAVRRLTGRDGIALKRPVVAARFYECKVCGRDMPNTKS